MPDFPPALQSAAANIRDHPGARALLEAPELRDFWKRIDDHVPVLVAEGWSWDIAAAKLVGDVVTPLLMGHDARGSFARAIRDGVSIERRRRAAALATELADMLREIEREPLAPDVVLSVLTCLPAPLRDMIGPDTPSYVWGFRTADALAELAAELEREPDFSGAPGLASRKPSWRGFLREVAANLRDLGFDLREADARHLVAVVCRAEKVPPPSRDSVRDALRSTET